MKAVKILWVLACVVLLPAAVSAKEEHMTTSLTQKQEAVSAVAALAAVGDLEKLSAAYNEALNAKLSINELKEITLQLYAYTGFPRCLNAAGVLENVVKARAEKGLKDETGPAPQALPEGADKYELGKKNLEVLTASSLPSRPPVFIQGTDTFLKEHLFADIFARGVLSFKDREIATVSALGALGNVNPQLQAHMGMAMNVGVTEPEMQGVIAVLQNQLGRQIAANAQKVFEQVLAARKGAN